MQLLYLPTGWVLAGLYVSAQAWLGVKVVVMVVVVNLT